MKQNKYHFVLLSFLIVCHLKYTLYAKMISTTYIANLQ